MFRYSADRWLMDRALDLVIVCGLATVDQSASKKYEKTYREVRDNILDLINPFKPFAESAKKNQAKDDEKREKYLEEVARRGAKGFGSLKEIKESLGMLGKTVREAESR